MARKLVPDPLARRIELERELAPARSLAIAEAYIAQGRSQEAIAFFAKAEATERLLALRDEAIASGDAFLAREVATVTRTPLAAEQWRRLADAARAAGKDLYAREAERQLGRPADGG